MGNTKFPSKRRAVTGALWLIVCLLIASLSDLIHPLHPEATWVVTGAAIAGLICFLSFFILRCSSRSWSTRGALVSSLLLILCVATISGRKDRDQRRGLLAGTVPAVGKWQEALGLVRAGHSGVRMAPPEPDTVSQSFAALATQKSVIANPQKPEEFYHNALIHEHAGQNLAARQSYLSALRFGLDYMDPHWRATKFLRAKEGQSVAAKSYLAVEQKSRGMAGQFAGCLLLEDGAKRQAMEEFLRQHPGFAPGFYLASLEYSANARGAQTLLDQLKETQLLEQFEALSREGKLAGWMIDQQVVGEWRSQAQARLTRLNRKSIESSLKQPVTVIWSSVEGGWVGHIQVAEPALEIFWKQPGSDHFVSTGQMTRLDPRTGRSAPGSSITLNAGATTVDFKIKYLNLSNLEMGPYDLTFDPAHARLAEIKRFLQRTEPEWLSFRIYGGKTLLHIGQPLRYREAVKSIRYGIDREIPDQTVPMANSITVNKTADSGDGTSASFAVPNDTQFATVQLTFQDGTQSNIVRVER